MVDAAGIKGHRWFAALYDRMTRMQERGRLGELRSELLSGAKGDVLEIGAGTGANFAHYPAGVRVTAVEPDAYMLKRARKRLAREPAAAIVELRQAPAERLPFDDASFDTAVSTLVLCTVTDVPAALAEIRRVLRPGGELRLLEHVRGGGFVGHAQDVIRPAWSWCAAGCQPNRDTEAALRTAGFTPSVEHLKLEPWMPAIIGTARVASSARDAVSATIVSTPQERDDAFAVRIAVFVDEQGISRADELDELDATAVHCVAYDGATPVGAGRLVLAEGYGKIGRMAVLDSHRGRDIGALVLETLEREGIARGLREFRLSAQLSARGFYDRAGYMPVGDVYDEVGIPHIAMLKTV